MIRSLTGLSLLLLLVATSLPSRAEPPTGKLTENNPDATPFTAFPDLKPRPFGPDDPHLIPVLPPLPADATPLRKVQHAQAAAGLRYVARTGELMRRGTWNWHLSFSDAILLTSETYIVAAECEDTLANRISWYEERVRKLKELEFRFRALVRASIDPPIRLHHLKFHRLQAELDLLALLDNVAKSSSGTPLALTLKKPEDTVFNPNQPPEIDTAFPELKPQTKEKQAVPLPRLPVLPSDAPMLRKVRQERVLEGFGFFQSASPVPIPLLDFYQPDVLHFFRRAVDTYQAAAAIEEHPSDRVPWYEACVRLFKSAEQYLLQRVLNGTDPPHKLDAICFYRFKVEAELIRLKAEAKKASPSTSSPPAREKFAFEEQWGLYDVKQRFYYTAFPDLTPRTVERIDKKDAKGNSTFEVRDADVVPLPTLPIVGPNTALAQRIRVEQVQEGIAYLNRIRDVILNGMWSSAFFSEYLFMTAETFRAAAEFESTPAKRISWYEARVRAFKDMERFTDIRVSNGTDRQERHFDARVQRLRAEAELLALKDEAAKPAPASVVVVPVAVCPTPCPPVCRPRGGLLPRLFHRR